MAEEEQHEVVIVGAGIAGLAVAVALKRVGIKSLVLEKAEDLRTTGAAISLTPNAWRALDVLGISHKLNPIYPPFDRGVVTNLVSGDVQEYALVRTTKRDVMGRGVRTLHRKALLKALAEELPPSTIRFSSKIISIKTQILEDSSTIALLPLEDGTIMRAKVLIGCDGVHSAVAQWLGLSAPLNSGRSAVRGLSTFPEGHGFKREVRQFVKHGLRAGFVPINDTDVYWFTVQYATERDNEMAKGDPKVIQREVAEFVAKDFPADFLQVVRNSDLSTITWAPLLYRSLWDLIVGGRTHKDSITVAGDAMHPMTPDLGQGGGSALEDAVVLARNIKQSVKVEEGLENYVKERKWRVASLIVGSFLSGWVQQGGSGLWAWTVKGFRDHVFYRFFNRWVTSVVEYDCGLLLPTLD